MIARMATLSAEDRRRARSARSRRSSSICREPLQLDCGRTLHPIRIAYETYGTLSPARDNVILVCHALSGDAHAAGFAKTPPAESTRDGFAAEDRDGTAGRGLGWWDGMIGPGKAFDTDSLLRRQHQPARRLPRDDRAVVDRTRRPASRTDPTFRSSPSPTWCARSARSSTSSASRGSPRWPADRSAACRRSSGRSSIPIRSTRSSPSPARTRCSRRASPGTRSRATPSWPIPTGRAATTTAPAARPNAGMGVARMVGHITYLSAKSLGDKFGRRLQFADDIRYTLTEPEFEVESYLRHQADTFVRRFDANTYLYTSRALTYFDLARQYGNGRLADALQRTSRRGRCSSRSAPTGCIRRPAPRSWPRRFARSARTSSSTSSRRPTGTTASCWRKRARRR